MSPGDDFFLSQIIPTTSGWYGTADVVVVAAVADAVHNAPGVRNICQPSSPPPPTITTRAAPLMVSSIASIIYTREPRTATFVPRGSVKDVPLIPKNRPTDRPTGPVREPRELAEPARPGRHIS